MSKEHNDADRKNTTTLYMYDIRVMARYAIFGILG